MIEQKHLVTALAKFKSTDDFINDDVFKKKLGERLGKLRYREPAPAGKKYVRGAWEYLTENRLWDTPNFIELAESIRFRRGTKRPMAVRDFVRGVMEDICRQTVVAHAEMEAEHEQE